MTEKHIRKGLSFTIISIFFAQTVFAQTSTQVSGQYSTNAQYSTASQNAQPAAQYSTASQNAQPAAQYSTQSQSNTASSSPVLAYGERRVIDVQIKGNYSVSSTTILNRLKIKPGDVYEELAVNKELKRIYAMGYFNDVTADIEDHTDGVIVIFVVVEKPIISNITFEGNSKLKKNQLIKKIRTKEGDLLDYTQLSQDVQEIKTYYTDEGYYRVGVEYRIDSDPKSPEKATVVFVIDEGQPLQVKKIDIDGNMSVKREDIIKLMATKTKWWFIQKGAFDEDKFQSDLARIASYYRSRGFLDAEVTGEKKFSENGKDLNLMIHINEGKKYKIGEITIEGDLAMPEEEVRRLILMRTGDPFDYEMMKEDIEKVRMNYYDKSYMNAEVEMEHKYNSTTDSMDLRYRINSGNQIYVGKVNVLGNTKTRDKVVRREVRVYPGEKYDGKKLRKSKERIYNLGYFEDVFFETVPTDNPDVKDLNVTVKETKTGEFSFGGGYSSIDSFIGFAQIRQKNFDILDFPTFTGAGQDLVIRAEGGSTRSNYYLAWTDPWIFDYPYLFGFDVYREEHNRYGITGYGYDETRTGGDLKLGKDITDELKAMLDYNLEEVKISNLPDDASDALRKEQGSNFLSSLTGSLNYDMRDNKFSPTKGYLIGTSLQDAGGIFGGDKNFVKGWLDGSYYYSIVENVVLETKAACGISGPYGDSDEVPIYERFFAGGGNTIRGYKERGVGPRDPGSNTAIGGESLFICSAEVTFPLFKDVLKGAVFYDAGNVWAKNDDIFSTELKMGAGVGVRVKTPIGPIKLDYGYPLSDNYDDDKEGEFYFSVSHGF
ncbi:MAG TPA: outer membrane protein assembly factor BamA [Candidatus Omnitrophota bacterium]|nr:outer membrane protein assembly factor BamA [Candidatus Omnitrophota bacterium]HPS20670.1 outer membrane protein assembly factor BamA [Candidatus Omnitrophota bacterium]